jgi:hypothetical protein
MSQPTLRKRWQGVIAAVLTCGALVVVLVALWMNQPPPAQAASNFQNEFLANYPWTHGTTLDHCQLCHTSGAELNGYGRDLAAHGHSSRGIENLDSDLDGFTNLTEITSATLPGDAASQPVGIPRDAQSPWAAVVLPANGVYKLIGWNDLGMHCMGPSYANISILPPYNTLWAQLILQGPTPQVIVTGVTIEYSIEDNTYSAGKTNFWQYAKALFGVNLLPNIGLAGKGLSGTMDPAGDHFIAAGIPLTAYRDSAPGPGSRYWYPYQIAHLVARDSTTKAVLAETRPVAPVSEEMNCKVCHADGMQDGIATGNVETNILTKHDREEGTKLMQNRPVLCQKCHGDNALGIAGNPDIPNLSSAIHSKHAVEGGARANASDPQNLKPSSPMDGTNNCYLCHPGIKTQCLRDIMYKNGKTCVDCHGTTAAVGNPNRRPWIDLPRCETCHPQFAENAGTRYRDSKELDHGHLYCEACHGSPHAILPSTQPNDNIQNIALQGFAGPLKDCTVCHGTIPTSPGPHGLSYTPPPTPTPTPTALPTCPGLPNQPRLIAPASRTQLTNRSVLLDWRDTKCATSYNITVRQDSANGTPVVQQSGLPLAPSQFKTARLARGHKYYWIVEACNSHGCLPSGTWSFTVLPR